MTRVSLLLWGLAACSDGEVFLAGRASSVDIAPPECVAGTRLCDHDFVLECDEEGKPGRVISLCNVAQGETCVNGYCTSICEQAAASRAYIGCEYWPTVTVNSHLGELGGNFDFAVALANPNAMAATVRVKRGETVVANTTVQPGQVATIVLPWVDELVQRVTSSAFASEHSVLVSSGAYHLTSSLPVTAYQFNPLQFESTTGACNATSLGSECSFTNDASLLLPTSALNNRYMVIARPSFSVEGFAIPGFFSVAATEDDTSVQVTFSAHTEPGEDFGAYAPGTVETFSLNRGDVLQIVSDRDFPTGECSETSVGACDPAATGGRACVGGDDYDLTGTLVEANHPVAVFSGHACAFVPYNRWACDHLEEQMFPLESWGTSLIAASTAPQVQSEPNVWKVVSGSAGNVITFEPRVHADVTLQRGESVEFAHAGGFRVTSTTNGRVALAQFMVGEDYNGSLCPPSVGDPSMGLVVPDDQFRVGYDFLTPATYTKSYVGIVAQLGSPPELDGASIPQLIRIGSSNFGFARVEIAAGAHHIESLVDPIPFGIMVSGIAPYTSYLYPGGLDLDVIPVE